MFSWIFQSYTFIYIYVLCRICIHTAIHRATNLPLTYIFQPDMSNLWPRGHSWLTRGSRHAYWMLWKVWTFQWSHELKWIGDAMLVLTHHSKNGLFKEAVSSYTKWVKGTGSQSRNRIEHPQLSKSNWKLLLCCWWLRSAIDLNIKTLNIQTTANVIRLITVSAFVSLLFYTLASKVKGLLFDSRSS